LQPAVADRPQPRKPGPARFGAAAEAVATRRLEQALIDGATAAIDNANTRAAYRAALHRFLVFLAGRGLESTNQILPRHVALYLAELGAEAKPATQRQHLAALRWMVRWLIEAKALTADPTAFLRLPAPPAPRPPLAAGAVHRILDVIPTDQPIDLRDRALLALMLHGCARIGAALAMRVEDYYWVGKRRWIRLHEKGGIRHELPAHPSLAAALDRYLAALGRRERQDWLFPALRRGSAGDKAGARPLSRIDAYRIVRKRAAAAGIQAKLGCHSLRAAGIAAFFAHGGSLAAAQAIAHHASSRSTLAYDRSQPEITLAEIQRIRF
jgi:site-specific recombinase XerD